MCRLLIVIVLCALAAAYCGAADQHEWNPGKWFQQNDNTENADQGCTELQVELDVSQKEVQELRNSFMELQAVLHLSQTEVRDLRVKNRNLEQRLAESDQNITKAKASSEGVIAYLESKTRKHESVISEYEAQKSNFEKVLRETMEKLTLKAAETVDLLAKQVTLEAEKSNLLAMLENSKNNVQMKDTAAQEICKAEQTSLLSHLEAEKTILNTKVTGLETDKTNLLNKLANLDVEKNRLKAQEGKCKSDKSVVVTENSDLTSNLDRCRAEIMCLENKFYPNKSESEDCLKQQQLRLQKEVAQLIVDKFSSWYNVTRDEDIMYKACYGGHPDVVRARLDLGRSTEVTFNSLTCLQLAAARNHVSVIRVLLDRGALIDSVASATRTPLMYAAANGKLEAVKLLIDRGANLAVRASNDYMSALGAARYNNRTNIVSYLISKNAPE